MTKLKYTSMFCGMLILATSVGCGGTYDASVSGTVNYKGNALSRGTIKFNPVGSGTAATAMIHPDGKYTLKTGNEEGIVPGDYVVTVVSREPSGPPSQPGAPPPPGKPITPRKYQSPKTSGVKKTVAKGSQTIDIDLL